MYHYLSLYYLYFVLFIFYFFRVLHELHTMMKTYQSYQAEFKRRQSNKFEVASADSHETSSHAARSTSRRKLTRGRASSEGKLMARNEYILWLEASNR